MGCQVSVDSSPAELSSLLEGKLTNGGGSSGRTANLKAWRFGGPDGPDACECALDLGAKPSVLEARECYLVLYTYRRGGAQPEPSEKEAAFLSRLSATADQLLTPRGLNY
eukprot:RCo004156